MRVEEHWLWQSGGSDTRSKELSKFLHGMVPVLSDGEQQAPAGPLDSSTHLVCVDYHQLMQALFLVPEASLIAQWWLCGLVYRGTKPVAFGFF